MDMGDSTTNIFWQVMTTVVSRDDNCQDICFQELESSARNASLTLDGTDQLLLHLEFR